MRIPIFLKCDRTFREPIIWVNTLFMILFHAGALAAIFEFSWSALALAALLWWVAGSLGIGMGYHRLLTHRGYKTPKWMEYVLTVCGTLEHFSFRCTLSMAIVRAMNFDGEGLFG